MNYVLIGSSKGLVSALSVFGKSGDFTYVLTYNNKSELSNLGIKIISFKTFFGQIVKVGMNCEKLVTTESIFNFKLWFCVKFVRSKELIYLDNLVHQNCSWEDIGFWGIKNYVTRAGQFPGKKRSQYSFIKIIKYGIFCLVYPLLFYGGLRIIILNNGVVGYRMIFHPGRQIIWEGGLNPVLSVSKGSLIILLPLANEPLANEYLNSLKSLLSFILSGSSGFKQSIFFKAHPRLQNQSYLSDFFSEYKSCTFLPANVPLEFYDLTSCYVLTHRSSVDVVKSLGFFCFGGNLGLGSNELIGVRAKEISVDHLR